MMTEKWRQAFESNYQIYIKRQWDLIDACFEALDLNNNEHDVENALRHLEQMFGRSSTAKKVYWAASHHLHLYTFWQFFNVHLIPADEFEHRHSWKYTFAKNLYRDNEQTFIERDRKVLERLKSLGSKFYLPYDELLTKKEYFPNMVELYSQSLKSEQE